MLKAFDETNAGVKGLVDSVCKKSPRFSDIQKPEGRKRIVEEVKIASETWGFFQVMNHGIPTSVLDGMIDGIRKFNDQDVEEKKKYYSRDIKRRDTMIITFPGPDPTDHHDLPAPCRESTVEYSKHVEILGNILFGLLSEALGLDIDHLNNMDCSKEYRLHNHYYPACPEPELAIGLHKPF
ncbi:1-aminocyclopropane-1-carboxylate oxidase homolog 1 [Phtheirospermum japonicum]|uniref:1-aminocyclopropane-1-carboxylate oxidase homolog 1 n=1 Tax=Phtheirospermum japonicum TaxID=374723 RepID=A0A830CR64_9LAMI|nr:1-aminocyclopropane-1-carboxylate oxidase homolog 1 [Phtheirospermum japonicum]